MKIHIEICSLVLILLISACYEDKGNYDYSEINEMMLSFSPLSESSNENSYIFSMPQEDTMSFELSAAVEQTKGEESNLEYRWRISTGNQVDTVYAKSYTFKFPPQKTRTYNVLFAVKDLTTGVESYRSLLVKTVVPFLRSWLVLHGQPGDRRIAALEYDASHENVQRVVPDIYAMMQGGKRFRNAISMAYTSTYDRDLTKGDKIFLLEPDSCFWVYPFTCEVKGKMFDLMPPAPALRFAECVSGSPNSRFGLIDAEGKLYHSGMVGYFYNALKSEDMDDYRVDKIYIPKGTCMTLWDNQRKRFMYYNTSNNRYDWSGKRQNDEDFGARIMLFPENAVRHLDLTHKEVVWMGRGLTTFSDEEGASVLLRDELTQAYQLLDINYGGGGKKAKGDDGKGDGSDDFVTTEVQTLVNPDFNETSVFASTSAFGNQLFYSLGNEVYLYNLITGESSFLYSVGNGNKITAMAFQMENQGTMDSFNAQKNLGIAVETANGQGEFHVLYLNEAGDVNSTAAYDGFGPIVDFCFTYLEHRGYDLL